MKQLHLTSNPSRKGVKKINSINMDKKKVRFWSHGPHCNCGYCRPMEGNEKYIVYDNGGDFDRITLPKKIGGTVLLEDQSGVCYTLTKVRK